MTTEICHFYYTHMSCFMIGFVGGLIIFNGVDFVKYLLWKRKHARI